MKALLLIFVFVSILSSDGLQRINIMIKDISDLHNDYEQCKYDLKQKSTSKSLVQYSDKNSDDELLKYKKLLKNERKKNKRLEDKLSKLSMSLKKARTKKKAKVKKAKAKVKIVEVVKLVEVCSNPKKIDPNPFPKLIPKK